MSGVRFRERRQRPQIDLNVTSLVDVLFLLLIFFLLTSTFKRAGELELQLPESTTSGPAGGGRTSLAKPVEVVLTEQGTLMLDGQPTTFERLLPGLRALHARDAKAQVTIEAEAGVEHGQVVRVLDAVRTAGYTGVGIGTRKARPEGAKPGR